MTARKQIIQYKEIRNHSFTKASVQTQYHSLIAFRNTAYKIRIYEEHINMNLNCPSFLKQNLENWQYQKNKQIRKPKAHIQSFQSGIQGLLPSQQQIEKNKGDEGIQIEKKIERPIKRSQKISYRKIVDKMIKELINEEQREEIQVKQLKTQQFK